VLLQSSAQGVKWLLKCLVHPSCLPPRARTVLVAAWLKPPTLQVWLRATARVVRCLLHGPCGELGSRLAGPPMLLRADSAAGQQLIMSACDLGLHAPMPLWVLAVGPSALLPSDSHTPLRFPALQAAPPVRPYQAMTVCRRCCPLGGCYSENTPLVWRWSL
jgi:hypothetical protein